MRGFSTWWRAVLRPALLLWATALPLIYGIWRITLVGSGEPWSEGLTLVLGVWAHMLPPALFACLIVSQRVTGGADD